jgi:glutamyl-tRNA synthetase
MRDGILKYALENAVSYDGQANVGSVIGHVIKEHPEAKQDIDQLKQDVAAVVNDVNQLTQDEQRNKLQEIAPELLEDDEDDHDIFEQFSPEGDVVTAFPPEPSKYPHIGHAKSVVVNHEYAKRHDGTIILRFEDTNPENVESHYYDIHQRDYDWLGIDFDNIDYASDHIDTYYDHCETLINQGDAYVTTASSDEISQMRRTSSPIPDRDKSVQDNLEDWHRMLDDELDAVVLAKIDLDHKNTTMRDPTLFRIIDEPHPRTGDTYHVWPTYDFANAVMDALENITMRFRTKEFELRSELQRHLQERLDLTLTATYEFARFELEGVLTSGRKIRELVDQGELLGWDDPSLATLAALRRRGFTPEAIRTFVLNTGISKTESTVTWDDLIVCNRRVLDESAERYFYIDDPVKITIQGAPERDIELHLDPNKKNGGRPMHVHDTFYIERDDYEALDDGGLYRFMECLNFTKEGDDFVYHSTDYLEYKDDGDKIMHFLPVDETVEATILMPDKERRTGIAEANITTLNTGDVIQFERFGFARLDIDNNNTFWYTHD